MMMGMDESRFSEPKLYSIQKLEASHKPNSIQKNAQQRNSPFFKKREQPFTFENVNDTFRISSISI